MAGMEFYLHSNEAWQALEQACRSATRTIRLEQYILLDDPIGREFLALLTEKAQQGVEVTLLLDGFGSYPLRGTEMLVALERAGGKVIFYHPVFRWNLLFPWTWFPRNHCKTLHIDGTVSFIGSLCIASYMEGWRDTYAQLTGTLAEQAAADFQWLLGHLHVRRRKRPGTVTQGPASYVPQRPEIKDYPLSHELFERIDNATRTIRLATPYFFPTRGLRKRLQRARDRGVRITLLLSERTDVPWADSAMRGTLQQWHAMGIEVALYRATIMHAKYAIIDEAWATFGSCNFDFLSLGSNREANIVFRDADHAAVLLAHWQMDLQHAVTYRPGITHPPSPIDRCMGMLARAV